MSKYLFIPTFLLFLSCGAGQKEDELEEGSSTEKIELHDESDFSDFGTKKFFWTFESDFSDDEQNKLKSWIEQIGAATIKTIGQYPFDVDVTFERTERNVPCSFGHTVREERQGLYFYVNPKFSLDEFLADWTGPHEISHLSMPFVGKSGKWFAEGYATYLSRRILLEMDYMDEQEFDSLYCSKINETMQYFCSNNLTFPEVCDSLLDNHEYGSMYWGSTSFFMTSDSLLQEHHGLRFTDVVASYQSCCRMKDKSLREVIGSYDDIIGDTIFTSLMKNYRNSSSGEVMKGY